MRLSKCLPIHTTHPSKFQIDVILRLLHIKVHKFWKSQKNLANSSPYFCPMYCQSKVRFCKILWPSQNIWTLLDFKNFHLTKNKLHWGEVFFKLGLQSGLHFLKVNFTNNIFKSLHKARSWKIFLEVVRFWFHQVSFGPIHLFRIQRLFWPSVYLDIHTY